MPLGIVHCGIFKHMPSNPTAQRPSPAGISQAIIQCTVASNKWILLKSGQILKNMRCILEVDARRRWKYWKKQKNNANVKTIKNEFHPQLWPPIMAAKKTTHGNRSEALHYLKDCVQKHEGVGGQVSMRSVEFQFGSFLARLFLFISFLFSHFSLWLVHNNRGVETQLGPCSGIKNCCKKNNMLYKSSDFRRSPSCKRCMWATKDAECWSTSFGNVHC